jgi:1-phosphatidylinositol-3-phosphate 5-kinase
MSSHDSPQASTGPPSIMTLGFGSRRGSLASMSASTPIDKEQLAQALDKIHSTASHSETLTTFNEFASPPPFSSNSESKGLAGDIMQNGLSGLYSRFRGVVGAGKDKHVPSSNKVDTESMESIKSQHTSTPTSKYSIVPTREDSSFTVSPVQTSTSSSRLQSPTTSSFAGNSSESQSQAMKSSKTSFISTPATSKSTASGRPSMTKATASSAIVPTVAPINVSAFNDREGQTRSLDTVSAKVFIQKTEAVTPVPLLQSSYVDPLLVKHTATEALGDSDVSNDIDGISADTPQALPQRELVGGDGSLEMPKQATGTSQTASSALSSLQASGSSRVAISEGSKRPAAIERITQSHLPGYQASRASSTDRSTSEASPIDTPAHNSLRHETISPDELPLSGYLGRLRIPGTTVNEGAPEVVNATLEQMRKQVLSKEFWMADDICKECFLCGDPFSAFRRKHHCRTCGCIFDSKCTSIITGQRFGVQGSLRVCKTCLYIINRRHDSSGSDDSVDESELPALFHTQRSKLSSSAKNDSIEGSNSRYDMDRPLDDDRARPLSTPMMAIPATRRIGESTKRQSLVLDIDAPQLSRPSSARSLKTVSATGRPPSSSHKRHLSKHNFLGRFKPTTEERAPFHRGVADDLGKRSRLPAFHDDNIIDPDLAPYMSDEESSADEQMSIFATMNSDSLASPAFENDRSGFGSLLSASKKHRARAGEKSVSGISFTSRGIDEANGSASLTGFTRPNRRRNPSAASSNLHLSRTSPRQVIPGFGHLNEEMASSEVSTSPQNLGPSKMIRSASMRDAKAPVIELNNASLHHVGRLLRQLLQDASIPNIPSWEKALIPLLLQCTDDVNPDVRLGDDIDIRHYVKLKKIPGGRPGDTSYVSGVVFSKNLALKSMPRVISNPRIVIVSFPIEYQRHQQHFMSLEPVIAQEKEFLRNMVNRIASLRPQLLLVQKNISGLALQYLAEANIAVAYNVKQSVIEAVSRCAQTEIISSIDMVALKPVHIGKSAGFEVKTYVHQDIPGKKKTYIYLSGCPKELGCTIALRGASMAILSKMKRITEFMVYVVYNLKLETCLMRDEFVLIPSGPESSGSLSPSRKQASQALQSGMEEPVTPRDNVAAASDKLQAVTDAGENPQHLNCPEHVKEDSNVALEKVQAPNNISNAYLVSSADELVLQPAPSDTPKFISAHESHAHGSHDDQLPEDIPMPTFYSDMVAKHQTKILSASPFVKFMQPYLLMQAREQERRLVYLKRLRDQDTFEEQTDQEKPKSQKFQLIKPEMVHETVKRAPRPIMEVLHAVHDAEYDKALHNYQTQKRQWESYIQGNINLFDPYAHQNITVLYTVVCTATTIPCAGPELLALAFYNEHEVSREFDPDCTLGQYVEDLCLSANTVCTSNGCEREMSEHHRTYVHGEARITVFVEKAPCKIKGLQDSILMWSYCKTCKKETQVMPMSESTWKYSLGKYLELSFWSSGLRLRAGFCPHDLHRDHLRYFGFRNVAIRIHYDPIDLLEIIVPRARITWKVDNDLRLKNEIFTKIEERWNRFMTSVNSRIRGINIDSVAPEKVEACKEEVDRLTQRAQDEHSALIRKLQDKYMDSKYYEIIPLNRAVRAMQEKVAEWDDAFANFDADFFPSEKDIRRLAALQLKKMFMDRDESTPIVGSSEGADLTSDVDEKSGCVPGEINRSTPNVTSKDSQDVLTSVVEESSTVTHSPRSEGLSRIGTSQPSESHSLELEREGIEHLDLALPQRNSGLPPLSESPASRDPSPSINPAILEGTSYLPLASTMSEKVEQLRKARQPGINEQSHIHTEAFGIPRPAAERAGSRRSGLAVSPPLNRTQSQPAGMLRRIHPSSAKGISKAGDSKMVNDMLVLPLESLKPSATEPAKPTDKKLSERLGLGTLKPHRKTGHSLIPRSVHGKRKESMVSTLAKHFEQLSREFEKERLRDRRQRAAKVTQSRAFPKASSKPIVEVYKDVNEAVEERGPTDEELLAVRPSHSTEVQTTVVGGLADLNTELTAGETGPHSPTDTAMTADETATEAETDADQHNVSQTGSDDDGAGSDADHSLLDDMLPGGSEIAESLRKPNTDMPLDIPKHEKSSLMKMLTNFWAERSASGWTPLEYPINAGEHIFIDEDIIVREDEPSSLIAFTLQSQHYRAKLAEIRSQGSCSTNGGDGTPYRTPFTDIGGTPDHCEDGVDQAEVETSLLRATGTHLAYSFVASSARMQCKIFFAEQFDAVRRKCGVADRISESLSRCLKWDSKGGKTKSVFLKTLDDRLVLKSLSPIETQAFLKFAPAYFNIMAEALFHDLPTVIAKMLGFYQIVIKNPATGTEIKWDVLVMENLFYDRSPNRIFDLKGSMRNRKIQSTGEQNEVLLDENMVEFIYESPLFAREVNSTFNVLWGVTDLPKHSKKLLRAAIFNDTLFLQRNDVMDYSLMVAVDEVSFSLH